jgi:hypothetical protein
MIKPVFTQFVLEVATKVTHASMCSPRLLVLKAGLFLAHTSVSRSQYTEDRIAFPSLVRLMHELIRDLPAHIKVSTPVLLTGWIILDFRTANTVA